MATASPATPYQPQPHSNPQRTAHHQVSRDLITALHHIPRVSRPPTDRQRREAEERGEAPPPPPPSFYEVVAGDEDATVRAIVTITTGITGVSEPVQVRVRVCCGAVRWVGGLLWVEWEVWMQRTGARVLIGGEGLSPSVREVWLMMRLERPLLLPPN